MIGTGLRGSDRNRESVKERFVFLIWRSLKHRIQETLRIGGKFRCQLGARVSLGKDRDIESIRPWPIVQDLPQRLRDRCGVFAENDKRNQSKREWVKEI